MRGLQSNLVSVFVQVSAEVLLPSWSFMELCG